MLDAQCVAGDQVARGRDGHPEVRGGLGQHPHHDELGGPDAEGTDGEREQRDGHGSPLRVSKRLLGLAEVRL